MTEEEPTVTFTRTDPQTAYEYLHARLEEIKASAYGEALSIVLIVDTEDTFRAYQFGNKTDTDTLKLIDIGRKLIKHGCRLEAE